MKNILIAVFFLNLTACSTLKVSDNNKKYFSLKKDWVTKTPDQSFHEYRKINRMSPVVVNDQLLIQGNSFDGLAGYNPNNGQVIWRSKINNGVEASSEFFKDTLYVSALDGQFYAIDASSGKTKWTYNSFSENLSEATLDKATGIIYFLSGNNSFHALDAENGKLLWHYQKNDSSNFSIRGGSKPAVTNKYVYVGFSDGFLLCFDKKSGQLIWEKIINKNKRFKDVDSNLVIDGDRLLVSGFDDSLHSINLESGNTLWKLDSGSFSGASIQENLILYPTTSSEVLAINKETGQIIWKYTLPEGIATKVHVYKSLVIFGESQGDLVFLDLISGKKMGSFTPGKGILSSPTVDDKNGKVYFISGEANLYSIKFGWENQKWFGFLN